MKVINKLTIFLFLFISIYANAQVDAIKIASAKKAIENKDYQIALQTLADVSNVGRKNKMYLYYSGEAHYNLLEYDSAEFYFKKYFILDVNNESVVEKLADIDYKRKKVESDNVLIEQLINELNNYWVKYYFRHVLYKVSKTQIIQEEERDLDGAKKEITKISFENLKNFKENEDEILIWDNGSKFIHIYFNDQDKKKRVLKIIKSLTIK